MAEPNVNKSPMGLEEGAKRGATYGALVAAILIIVGIVLWLHNSTKERVDFQQASVLDLRNESKTTNERIAKLREEFVEFRAEVRGEFKAARGDLEMLRAEMRANHAELTELLKQKK